MKGTFAACRRVRLGLPAADPPGGRCNQCRSRCSERNLNAMPLCDYVAGGLRSVMAGGSAALGLAGHILEAWGAAGRGSAGFCGSRTDISASTSAVLVLRSITVVRGFINPCHCRGGGSIRGRPG